MTVNTDNQAPTNEQNRPGITGAERIERHANRMSENDAHFAAYESHGLTRRDVDQSRALADANAQFGHEADFQAWEEQMRTPMTHEQALEMAIDNETDPALHADIGQTGGNIMALRHAALR
jgi:hypothetical protein